MNGNEMDAFFDGSLRTLTLTVADGHDETVSTRVYTDLAALREDLIALIEDEYDLDQFEDGHNCTVGRWSIWSTRRVGCSRTRTTAASPSKRCARAPWSRPARTGGRPPSSARACASSNQPERGAKAPSLALSPGNDPGG